eukprot:288847-Pyramimonas_sp.AAC.1
MSTRLLRPSGPRRHALFHIGLFLTLLGLRAKKLRKAQISKANEGGDAFFVEGHRQAQSTADAKVFPELAVASCSALDGFLPITVHMQ